ncbi:MAG: hypothetical protein GY796_33970 [Chloroflexi bacterium]|nr:hypothetical protein [Chloroflexota bacterium]
MAIVIERPYPVSATVIMRCALFALANMGAKLQAYNEDSGVIVATVTRRMGLQKEEMAVRVRPFADTCQLEVEAPNPERAQSFLNLVSNYVRDGSKVHTNATMQWIDMQRQAENQARRGQLVNRAKNLLPGSQASSTAVIPIGETEESALVTPEEANALARMPIPDNPGVLLKNPQDKIVEIQIDPAVFTDRTSYLQVCEGCQAAILKGSLYCSNCGRPLTLEAVQPELRTGASQSARSSLTYGLAAVALTLVPFLILILPVLLNKMAVPFLDQLTAWITPLKIGISAIVGLAPGLFMGIQSISRARQAAWYMNLRAAVDAGGRTRANIGSALGWLAIYMGIGWILFIVLVMGFGNQ